ncbi:hypothetical protein ABZ946_31330 [Streptomyces sp. NPDC046324]|uniref:hypothetical protein n=1 Tax=Streptomyces sp. NPDC046324 TaxID=3154915 RepID=UPI0033CD8509
MPRTTAPLARPRRYTDHARTGHDHQFGGNVTRAERSTADVDFRTDLVRLAAGGKG